MNHPKTVLLYVDNIDQTAKFFHTLFGAPIVEQSENFAMLALSGGFMLGLWARHDVKPVPTAGAAGFELCVTLDSDAATEAAFAEARTQGVVVQEPVRLDFGYTFLLKSPDGHLIRVFNPPSE